MSDPDVSESQRGPRRARERKYLLLLTPVVAVGVVWALNLLLVGHPVKSRLSTDPRNQGFSLRAHYAYYLDLSTLVLDLREFESAAPADLFRALFQSAEAFVESGRTFEEVVLARAGTPVFLLDGSEFSKMGAEYSAGQNPLYLIRTLPEKLFRPTGEAAFGRWEGGFLGVMGKQVEDANEAARQWEEGE